MALNARITPSHVDMAGSDAVQQNRCIACYWLVGARCYSRNLDVRLEDGCERFRPGPEFISRPKELEGGFGK